MELLPQHSWHPMVIHFPLVGLLLAVGLDAYGAWSGSTRWRGTATLLWWVGLFGVVAAIATGLIAYNRVDHSEIAHVQMTLHRNLAFATVGVLLCGAAWRWRRPFARGAAFLGVLGAVGLLGVGYLGGGLVYQHAVGVPTEAMEQIMMQRGGHEHDHEHEHGDAHAHAVESDTGAAAAVVRAFHLALSRGDSAGVLALLGPDVTIIEGGVIESRQHYQDHHLPADLAFARVVPMVTGPLSVVVQGEVAWVASSSRATGKFEGRSIDSQGVELMVLSREAEGWKIRSIHWSSQ